jgi:NADPH:quinone reductase-like Zn-dependent oxidoreductase
MRYKSVVVTKRGGTDVLQVVEKDLRPPSAREVRIEIFAPPVCRPDIQARYGQTLIPPKVPFVRGCAIVGTVDAAGRAKRSGDRERGSGGIGAAVGPLARQQALTRSKELT